MKNSSILLFAILLLSVTGAVQARYGVPQTAIEHFQQAGDAIKHNNNKYIKMKSFSVGVNIVKASENFWTRAEDCYDVKRDIAQGGIGKGSGRVMHSTIFTPTMKWTKKNAVAYFGLQMLDLDENGKVQMVRGMEGMPKKGMYAVSAKFEKAGPNKTNITMIYPFSGFGDAPRTYKKWAAGKSKSCPFQVRR